MKKYFTILTVIASVLACTPNLAPEYVLESGNGSQSTEETPVPVQSVELNTAALTLEIGETAECVEEENLCCSGQTKIRDPKEIKDLMNIIY